jgi:thiamine-phosphate pyrophosphorylase
MREFSGGISDHYPRHLLRARLRGLYVITEEGQAPTPASQRASRHEEIARAALAGGASIIQLRDKSTPLPQLYHIALSLRRLTRAAGALFFVNDRPDLALASDADGVHLGPDDLPIVATRRVLGPHRLIGVSCGDIHETRAATQQGADYIGAGAIFSTTTKLDAGLPVGLSTLREIVATTPLPVAAIGGLNPDNIASVSQSGAAMACVVSAVSNAPGEAEMTAAARRLLLQFNSGLQLRETSGR